MENTAVGQYDSLKSQWMSDNKKCSVFYNFCWTLMFLTEKRRRIHQNLEKCLKRNLQLGTALFNEYRNYYPFQMSNMFKAATILYKLYI